MKKIIEECGFTEYIDERIEGYEKAIRILKPHLSLYGLLEDELGCPLD